MMKIVLGAVTALLLAACAYTPPEATPRQANAMTTGVGHPTPDYPGPRLY